MSKKLQPRWLVQSVKAILILLISAYSPAWATAFNWASTVSEDWSLSTNWSPHGVPGLFPAPFDSAAIGIDSDITAIIPAGSNYTLDTLIFNSTVAHLVSNFGSLTLAGTGIVQVGPPTAGQTVEVEADGALFFENSASAGNNGVIGINTLLDGETTFRDTSTGGNATISSNSNGIVNFQDNSSAAHALIRTFNTSETNFQDNSSAGNSLIETSDFSVVNFQDNSSAAAATIFMFDSSEMNFQDNSSPANAAILMFSNEVINFTNTSPSTVYSGLLDGAGTINVGLGSGSVLTFLGDNSSSYTGAVNINSGTFALGDAAHPTASVGGDVNINNTAAAVSGFGTAGGNVTNNGQMTPGDPLTIGTLSVLGNYTQTAFGSYVTKLSQAGTNDLLEIGGSAMLNDGELSVLISPFGFKPNFVYRVLTAGGGVIGTFNSDVIINGRANHPFLQALVTYPGDEVDLELFFAPVVFEAAAVTPNQIAVSNYLLATGGTPGVQALINSLTTAGQFQAAMDQISGATYANQTMSIAHVGSLFEHELANRLMAFPSANDPCCICPNGQLKYRNRNQAPGGWVSVYGAQDDINAGQVSGLITNSEGVALGYEWPMNCQTKLGLGVGYTHFRGHATDREVASDNGNLLQAGIYGRYERCGWLFGAAVDIGTTNELNTERHVQGETAVFSPRSHYRANLISEQVVAAYDLLQSKRCWKLRPFVGFINQQVNSDGFTEQGNSGFELNVGSNDYHSARSQLGVLWEAPMTQCVRPFASVDWEHEFADRNGSFNASLVGLTTPPTFHIVGQEIGRDSAAVKAGVNLVRQGRFNLAVLYQGQFASGWQQNGAALEAGFRFD